jgi:hypothetical protein
MTRAYPRDTVHSLIRTLNLDSGTNVLTIEDAYRFTEIPEKLEEAFVTFEKASIVGYGDAVRIGPVRGGVTLSAAQPGLFQVETMTEKRISTPPMVGVPAFWK